jgi:hypothetical protein
MGLYGNPYALHLEPSLCYPQAKDATSTRDASEMAEEGAVQMDELFSALGIILEVLATSISLKHP